MKKKKEKKLLGNFRLLNPKNLQKEVHVYGYNFSWKTHLLLILCALLGISAIGIVFRLLPVYFAVIIAAVIICLPLLILDAYKRMFEQKRFADAATYAEQMLYSFEKSGKILLALKETRTLFDAGLMADMIDRAVAHLEKGVSETEKGVLRESLELIEEPYRCVKLHTVHELLVSTEEYGGETDNAVMLLLEDIERWKRRGYKLQADKKTSYTDNMISIVVSVVLCAVALYVLDGMGTLFPGTTTIDIFRITIIQMSSTVFILFMLYTLKKSTKSLTSDWLQEQSGQDDGYILDSYDAVMQYDDAREKRKSILFAAPFLVAAVPVFIFYKTWLGIVLILIGTFMLLQHRVGHSIAKKDVNREMYVALPQWLMEMALLLQNNNVQVSLAKSIDGAPAVLQRELEALIERLREAPGSLKSYTDFCKDFDIPEAQSCMKMLHAISESGTGNAQVQINNLLMRVNEMQDAADQIRNESEAFKTKMIFSFPVLGATVKLLIDLSVGMVVMMGMMGSMGGV